MIRARGMTRSAGVLVRAQSTGRVLKQILIGITCTHRRMRRSSCGICKKPCMWSCPDCGLEWQWNEGVYG